MNVVFLGTPPSAIPSLAALRSAGHIVSLVVTQPDRPARRSATPRPPPVKDAAVRWGIEVIQPPSIREGSVLATLRGLRPDLLVVVAYGRILPKPLLELARRGAVNVHFSLLPRYRGAAPVQWALACGESITGVTTMRINERLDEGDILLQRPTEIEPGEHAPRLLERLSVVGASLLLETLDGLGSGTLEGQPQDHSRASFAPLLTRRVGEADFHLSASEIEGRVRGFDPWPGVWVRRAGTRLRIVEARAVSAESFLAPPGLVFRIEGDSMLVACGGGTVLAVAAIQPEGRRVLSIPDAANGRQIRTGDQLEGPARPA